MLHDEIIRKYIGSEYVYKGRSDGLDCYGLVWRIYKDIGIDIPDFTFSDDVKDHIRDGHDDIMSLSKIFVKVDIPKVYDIIAFVNHKGIVNHAGVFIGGGRFIHATKQAGVVCAKFHDKQWDKRMAGIYRHKELI